jgi:hypothetical protein
MSLFKFTIAFLSFSFACQLQMYAQQPTITSDAGTGLVCIGLPVQYRVDYPTGKTQCGNVQWTIKNSLGNFTSGFTSSTNPTKIIWSEQQPNIVEVEVVVNFISSGGSCSAPETVTLSFTHTLRTVYQEELFITNPPPPIDYCAAIGSTYNISVSHMYIPNTGTGSINLTEVDSYEWALPAGWKETGTNRTGTIYTAVNFIVVEPITRCVAGGNVTVRGVANNISCGSLPVSKSLPSSIALQRTPVISLVAPPGYTGPGCNKVDPVTFTATYFSCATNYAWQFPSGWSGTSTSNSITLTPSGSPSDGGTIRATITLGNCTLPVVSYQVPYTAPSINLAGPNAVCNSGNTFSLSGVPNNSSVNWQATPSNLFINASGSGTSAFLQQAGASGQGSISFSVNNSHCAISLSVPSTPLSFWVGNPIINSSYVTITDIEQCEHWMVLGAVVSPSSSNGVSRYYWTEYDPTGTSQSIGEGLSFLADIYVPPLAGVTRNVYSFAKNACSPPILLGSKEYEYRDWDTCTSPPPYGCGAFVCLTATPNPATSLLTISFQKKNGKDKVKKSDTAEIKLRDSNQVIMASLSTSTEKDVEIPVKHLPAGIYYLEVIHSDGDKFQRRIKIE